MKLFSQKTMKSAMAAATASVMLFSTALQLPVNEVAAADTCVITTGTEYQMIRGFGGINHPEWTGQDLTAAQRQTAFGNGDGELGFTILRVFVNPDKNLWNLAVPTAKAASDMGVTVFASPWEPPSDLAESGGSNGKLHLPESNYGAYAQHLNDFGTYMANNGVDLYSISVQNEPDYASEWTYWSSDETTNFLANYGDKITSTRVMSPESFQYTPENASWILGGQDGGKKYYNKILNNAKAMANCDLFGTHFYGTTRDWMDFPALENCGKEIWMTEVYVPNSEANSNERWPEAIQVAENIHNGLVVGNMSAYVWWYIRRNYGPMNEDGTISKRGYMMAQYSKYVRPGDVRIGATEQPADGVYVSAYKGTDNQVTIVAINNGTEGYSQNFSFSDTSIIDVDRYRSSASENLAVTNDLENDGTAFWAQLPAQSVSTFVVTLEGGIKESEPVPEDPVAPEPDENGYYFHDTFEGDTFSWTGHGSSDVLLSGRSPYMDAEALLVHNRESAWNGAEKSLNAAAFVPGNQYSFSVCAAYLDGTNSTETFKLTLQYEDASGETKFSSIATGTAVKGSYVQLANTNYTIPEGASNMKIYVETETGTNNFYIDEAIGAVAGTVIAGPEEVTFLLGDVNSDGVINSLDIAAARKGITGSFASNVAALAADVNEDGTADGSDLEQIQNFVMGRINEFTAGEKADTSVTISMADYTAKIQSDVVEFEPDASHNEVSGVQYGTVQASSYWSTTCNREKKYNVLLPAGYSTSKKYPVLYVMHGYWENQDRMILTGNGTMYTRQIIGNAIAAGEAEDMIVVFPDIYSSATQASCSAMDDANNAAYDNFINDLIKDLMPHIEKTYSVKTGKDNTAITGFSMGGRESLLIGMQRSDLFGYVGSICAAPGVTGSFNWDSDEAPYLLFMTAGSNDTVVYDSPVGYHNSFTANGVPHIWHYVNGGYHGDNSIHAHLYNFVRAVFKAN